MKDRILYRLVFAIFMVMGVSACAFFKPAARTVNDAAKIACEAMFAEDAERLSLSLEDICATHEVLDPIIRQLLASKAAAAQGIAPPQQTP